MVRGAVELLVLGTEKWGAALGASRDRRVVITRKAERGQDPIVEMDVHCGQEGVEVSFHRQGFVPAAND